MESDHLILEISCSKIDLLRLIDTSHMVDLRDTAVALPLPLAAPAHKSEETILVAEVIYCVVLTPDVLETHAVHVHVHDIVELLVDALRSITKEDVICPTCTLEKNILSVEGELSVTVLVESACDLTDTESDPSLVRNGAFCLNSHVEVVKLRGSEVKAPPYARILYMEV